MKVATVIPAYNSTHLAETLRSVEQQTVQPGEVVVVDDGSASPIVLPPTDLPVRLVRQANRGVVAARSRGVAETSAPFVHILDHDELVAPTFYQQLLPALAGADVAYARMSTCDADGAVLPGVFPADTFIDTDDWTTTLWRGNQIGSSAAVVRRSLIEQVGGWDERFPTSHDWQLWLRAAQLGARFHFEPATLASHRRHSGQVTDDAPGRRTAVLADVLAMLQATSAPWRCRWVRQSTIARFQLELAAVQQGLARWRHLAPAAPVRPRMAVSVLRGRVT